MTHGKEEILPNHTGYPVHATGLHQQCKPAVEDKDAGEDKVMKEIMFKCSTKTPKAMHTKAKYATVMASSIILVTNNCIQHNKLGNSKNNNYMPVILNKKV